MRSIIVWSILIFSIWNMKSQNMTDLTIPRSIETTGKGSLRIEPDEINVDFRIITESKKNKGVRIPLLKLEDQIRQYLVKNKILADKLVVSSDPNMCTTSYKQCTLEKLNYAEFVKIKDYLIDNQFIENLEANYKITQKDQIKKYSESLLKLAFLNSKKKAEILAAGFNERIYGIQKIGGADFLEDDLDNMEGRIYIYETNFMPELENSIYVQYTLDSIKNEQYPKYLDIIAKGEKRIPFQKADISYNLRMEDYEEGDPKEFIDKIKKDIQDNLKKLGVKAEEIKSMNENNDEGNYSYKIEVVGETRIKDVYMVLLSNRNVKDIDVYDLTEDTDKYEKELIDNAINNAKGKLEVLERILGIKGIKIFEVSMNENYVNKHTRDYDDAVAVDYAATAAVNAVRGYSKVTNLEKLIGKELSISYLIK